MIGFFNQHKKDTDFMSELEAATSMRPATSATLMLFSIIGLVVFLFVWAAVSKVEEITRGSGQVVPSQEIQVVQSLEGGILAELLVNEGDKVEKGQVLLRISDVQFSSEERGVEARFLGLQAKKARLQAEASGKPFEVSKELLEQAAQVVANEQALYDSRQSELQNTYAILDDRINKATADLAEVKAQIRRFSENRRLLQEELKITSEMVRQRAAPKLEEIRLQREISDVTGQINANVERQKSLEAELQVSEKERAAQWDKFRTQSLGELNDVQTEISALEENLKSIGDRVFRTELRAPVTGIVNRLMLNTIGGVIEPAKPLIEIVPLYDELKIVAKVNPNEIAFLTLGQEAKVKILAYDPQKYGALEGKLVRVAANSETDQEGNVTFEVEVRTEKNYLGSEDKPLPITPGMLTQVEIITGKRTILEYFLKPLLRARDKVFTER